MGIIVKIHTNTKLKYGSKTSKRKGDISQCPPLCSNSLMLKIMLNLTSQTW